MTMAATIEFTGAWGRAVDALCRQTVSHERAFDHTALITSGGTRMHCGNCEWSGGLVRYHPQTGPSQWQVIVWRPGVQVSK